MKMTTAVPATASQDAEVAMDHNACLGSIGGGGSCSSSSGGSGSSGGNDSGSDGSAGTNGRGSGDSNSGGEASSSGCLSHTTGAGSEVASSSNCDSGSGSDSDGSSSSRDTSADSSSDGGSSSGSDVSTAETSGGASSRSGNARDTGLANARDAGLADGPVHRSGRAPDVAASRGSAPARLVKRVAPGATGTNLTNPATDAGSVWASPGTRPDVAGETSATGAKQAVQGRANNGAAVQNQSLQSLGSFEPGLQLRSSFQADARSQRPRGSVPALEGLEWVNQLQPSAQLSFATHATHTQAWALMATDPAGGRNAGAAAAGLGAAAGRGAAGVRGPAAVEVAGRETAAAVTDTRHRRSHGHGGRLSAPGHQLLVRPQEQDEKEQLLKRRQRQQQQGSEPQPAGRAGLMPVSVNLEDSSLPVAARAWLQGHFVPLQPSGELRGSSENTPPVPRRASAAAAAASVAAQGARLDMAVDQGDGRRGHGQSQYRQNVPQASQSRAEEGSQGRSMEGRHLAFGTGKQQEPYAHVQDRQTEGVTSSHQIWQRASREGAAEEQGRSRQRKSGTKPQGAQAVHRDAQHHEMDIPRRAESGTGKGRRRRSAAEALDARLGAGAGVGGAGDGRFSYWVFAPSTGMFSHS